MNSSSAIIKRLENIEINGNDKLDKQDIKIEEILKQIRKVVGVEKDSRSKRYI